MSADDDSTTTAPSEFPGFRTPGAPVFGSALGDHMVDRDGTRYLDLAMGFGVYLHGHGLPIPDLTVGMTTVAPGLGDVYAHESRDHATRVLCEAAARSWGDREADDLRALVLTTGSDAVETALKTALLATGRTRVVAFEGGYHGTFGMALAATHRGEFRQPFAGWVGTDVAFTPYGELPALDESVACVIVEPIQGRAGIIVPPEGFLAALRSACDEVGALLVVDSVLVGSGRCGDVAHGAECDPDLLCLGKALGAGVPASAVIARADVAARAWDRGDAEPIHASTFLGHPLSCAAIVRTVENLLPRAPYAERAARWEEALTSRLPDATGRGLAWGFNTRREGGGVAMARLLLGTYNVIVLPSGHRGESITLLPSLLTRGTDVDDAVDAIVAAARELLA
jgi:acetylornithine/succinyldiaminopimelate/putrescine aminotransferase